MLKYVLKTPAGYCTASNILVNDSTDTLRLLLFFFKLTQRDGTLAQSPVSQTHPSQLNVPLAVLPSMNSLSPSTPRYHIQLMYGNGGGGHKASAIAVQKALESCADADKLDVELVDASFIAGATLGDWIYNLLLSYDLVTAIDYVHTALHSIIFPVMRPSLRQAFRSHFAKSPSLNCVVSFVPFLNAIFAESLASHIPLMTVLTDFSHTPGHPWMQHPRQHVVAGTDIAVAQALSFGYCKEGVPCPSMRMTATSGMVVHPRFYSRISGSTRRRRRVDLGLPPDLPTVLILFGGYPPTERVLRLVDLFLDLKDEVNVITICAKNRPLFDRLTRRKRRDRQRRLFVTGFTTDIPLFMQVSDVLVGKPGPGVVSEAFVSGLPCVLVTGASESQVMKQERDVLDWVRRQQVGVVAHSEEAAARISQEEIAQMRQRIAQKPPNRAVFEVRDLILQQYKSDNNKITSTIDNNNSSNISHSSSATCNNNQPSQSLDVDISINATEVPNHSQDNKSILHSIYCHSVFMFFYYCLLFLI